MIFIFNWKEEIEYAKKSNRLADLAVEIYNSEDNFNNADPTSGQRCYELSDIKYEMEKVLRGECGYYPEQPECDGEMEEED